MSDVWREVAERLRRLSRDQAREQGGQPRRFRVEREDPLVLRALGNRRLRLEDGDDDLEVAQHVRDLEPEQGDVVICHRDPDGDWVATAVIR